MWVELGHWLMILGISWMLWLLAWAHTFTYGLQQVHAKDWQATAIIAWSGLWSCLIASFGILTLAFVQDDFTVQYVWAHSHSELPWYYKMTATWGGHEGSWLLWLVMMAGYGFVHMKSKRSMSEQDRMENVVAAIIIIALGGFVLLTSNPFLRLLPIPPDSGQDLNPLLQDPGFLIHPPCLYLGYVAMSMPCIVALSVLLTGKIPDGKSVGRIKIWSLWAWTWLTLGIVLGSWWAYRELGWGGFWFWDPVENASLLPWLIATTQIHAASSQNIFHRVGLTFLAILGFIVTLLGTFLVRSGVLVSVHAFAVDPWRGLYLLVIFAAMALWAFCVWAKVLLREQQAIVGAYHQQSGRERMLTIQMSTLCAMVIVVLIATLYPILLDVWSQTRISIGPSYYEQTLAPLVWALLWAMGQDQILANQDRISSQTSWRIATCGSILFSLMVGFYAYYIGQSLSVIVIITYATSAWACLPILCSLSYGIHHKHIAHMLIILILVCIVTSKTFERSQIFSTSQGHVSQFRGYDWVLQSITQKKKDNYLAQIVEIRQRDGSKSRLFFPQLRYFPSQNNTQTKAAIDRMWWGDWYLSISKPSQKGPYLMRIYQKPLQTLLWLAGIACFVVGLWSWYRVWLGRTKC